MLSLNRFDDIEHLARFLGVSRATVFRWQAKPDTLPGTARRLLDVLGMIERELPELYSVLVDHTRKPGKYKPVVTTQLFERRTSEPVTVKQQAENKAYWLEQWGMTGSSEIDSLSDTEYERIKELIGK